MTIDRLQIAARRLWRWYLVAVVAVATFVLQESLRAVDVRNVVPILFAIGLLFVVALSYLLLLRRIRELEKASLSHTTGLQRSVGLTAVLPTTDALLPTLETIAAARRSVVIVGITHFRLFNDNRFIKSLEAFLSQPRATLEVLFLDGQELTRAARNSEDLARYRTQIESAQRVLTRLGANYQQASVVARHYDEYPLWHVVIADDSVALCGVYSPGDKRASDVVLRLENTGPAALYWAVEKQVRHLRLRRSATGSSPEHKSADR